MADDEMDGEASSSCCESIDDDNCEENEHTFQEFGWKLCEQIEEKTTALAEEGKNDEGFNSDAYLQQMCTFDESFGDAQTCQHLVTDAKLTKCVSKLLLTEVQNFQNNFTDKKIDSHLFAQKLKTFLQEQCSSAGQDDEAEVNNQLKCWAAFSDRFTNEILRLPPTLSSLGPLLLDEVPEEVQKEVRRKKADRTKLKKSEQVVKLVEVQEDELVKRTDPLAKQLDNVLSCLKKVLKQRQADSCNYFEFCFHPTDFARTVENVFHTSFLVKENKVGLKIGSDNMPYLSLISGGVRQNTDDGKLNRGAISFSYEDWENVVKLLKITDPIITNC